tara:strand:- start:11477 stop:12307 length:831 start_codon:yes stop_codon:yes gene_type:complete
MSSFISSYSFKRLIRDVKNINKNPLTDSGIYYSHDTDNILKGYALIVGPDDTPYEKSFYFFEFNYPTDYPHTPPTVTFISNTENIRMHPNLYRSGKICISILNTWKGDQWTSCQNIQTILLTILSLFTPNPLLNEPGIKENNSYINKYNSVIDFISIKFNALDQLINLEKNDPIFYEHFIEHIIPIFKNNIDFYKTKIQYLQKNNPNTMVNFSIYNFNYYIDYDDLSHNMDHKINSVLNILNDTNNVTDKPNEKISADSNTECNTECNTEVNTGIN